MHGSIELKTNIRKDLCRLSSFGANIADAHSCFIFLPTHLFSSSPPPVHETPQTTDQYSPGRQLNSSAEAVAVELLGTHSLSNDIVSEPILSADSGLIGWVARHNRSIHVSPFERDSRTLGIYTKDQLLKSFIGIPVCLNISCASEEAKIQRHVGVIACDSKKSFAFSKLQGKLLEDLGREVASTVELRFQSLGAQNDDQPWEAFLRQAERATTIIGSGSVEVLRVQVHDFSDYEMHVGSKEAIAGTNRMYRLFKQLLPEHTPHFKLPDGSLVAVLDSMMGAYYENRMRATCDHVFGRSTGQSSKTPGRYGPNIEFRRLSFRDRGCKGYSLAQLIAATAKSFPSNDNLKGNSNYEYRRA